MQSLFNSIDVSILQNQVDHSNSFLLPTCYLQFTVLANLIPKAQKSLTLIHELILPDKSVSYFMTLEISK